MTSKISKHITKWLLRKRVIPLSESEIYQYGIFQMLMNTIEIFTILILGVLFQELITIITFTITFAILRAYAGGYHADAPWKCYLSTTAIVLIILLVMKFFEINSLIDISMWVVAGITIVLLAPVQTRNKMLDEIECIVYRKRAFIVWMCENVMAMIFLSIGLMEIVESIILGQLVVAAIIFVGKIDEKKAEEN